jgi:DNA-3-methyladenine glycosylase I
MTNQSSRDLDTTRCFGTGSPIYEAYHDEEWGVPIHDDRHLFELLILEGAQAGLSWETILKRRTTYRQAFNNFEIEKVANYGEYKIAELLQDAGIIRNKLKVNATIENANVALDIQKKLGSLNAYFWSFVPNSKPIQPDFASMNDVPPGTTPESVAMSKDLKKRGMTFVGPTITYAFMQSGGMTNDHHTTCPRHNQIKELSKI